MSKTPNIDIRPDHWEIVRAILEKHVPQYEVWAFGSRAKWTAKEFSDLDLAVITDRPLPLKVSAALEYDFSEFALPWKVDVVDWSTITDAFKAIIARHKIIIKYGRHNIENIEWPRARLKDICSKIGSGATPAGGKEAYKGGDVSLIRSQNIYNEKFSYDGLVYIDARQAGLLSSVEVKKNDILLNITGDSVARCNCVPVDVLPARVNQHVAIIRPIENIVVPKYLRYFFISKSTQEYLLALASSGATRNALTKGMLEDLEVLLPPLPEQRAIAHILGTLDDKIECNRRMNETLEAMARTIFKDWFVDFGPVRAKMEGRQPEGMSAEIAALFPDALDDEGKPEGWGNYTVAECCCLGRGASPRPINEYMNGDMPWIKIADATASSGPFIFATKEKIKRHGVEKSVTVLPGDLILSNSATCGIPMFVELIGCIHDGWLYFKKYNKITKLYLYHMLINLTSHLVNIADGSVQKNLNIDLVGRQQILVPPAPLLYKFDAIGESVFAKIRHNLLQSQTLAALRDTLLPKLVSGELRVKDAEKFVVEALDA